MVGMDGGRFFNDLLKMRSGHIWVPSECVLKKTGVSRKWHRQQGDPEAEFA